MSRNPVAGNAYKYNKQTIIPNKKRDDDVCPRCWEPEHTGRCEENKDE